MLPGRAIGYPRPTATHVLHPYVTDHCPFFQRKLANNYFLTDFLLSRSLALPPSSNDASEARTATRWTLCLGKKDRLDAVILDGKIDCRAFSSERLCRKDRLERRACRR